MKRELIKLNVMNNIKFIYLISLSCLCFSSSIFAQNYVKIITYETQNPTEEFLDISSINNDGEKVSFVIKSDLDSLSTSLSKDSSTKLIQEINCQTNKTRFIRSSYFEGKEYFDTDEWIPIVNNRNKNIEILVCKIMNDEHKINQHVSYKKTKENEYFYIKSSMKKKGDILDIVLVSNNNQNNYSKKYFVKIDCMNQEYRIDGETTYSDFYGKGNMRDYVSLKNSKIWNLIDNSKSDINISYESFCEEDKDKTKRNTKLISQDVVEVDISKLTVVFQPNADDFYPPSSKRRGEQGYVEAKLIIDKHGYVEEVRLLKSSNFPRLDKAAYNIVKDYQFNIYLVDDLPTKASTDFGIKFNLEN